MFDSHDDDDDNDGNGGNDDGGTGGGGGGGGSQGVLVNHTYHPHSRNNDHSNSGRPCAVLVYAHDGTPVDPYPTLQASLNDVPPPEAPPQDPPYQDPPVDSTPSSSWVRYYLSGTAPGPGSGLAQGPELAGAIPLPQGYVFTPHQLGRQTLTAVFDPRCVSAVNPPSQHILSTHPLNTPSQPTLSTHISNHPINVNAPCHRTLSPHLMNIRTPSQHSRTPPSQPTATY